MLTVAGLEHVRPAVIVSSDQKKYRAVCYILPISNE